MTTQKLASTIRAKKLGVLIRDARLASQKSLEECAQAIGASPLELKAYEMGESSPSLPQIELLAYYLNIPLEHFWGHTTLGVRKTLEQINPAQLVTLRQRMIGVHLRQARAEAGYSVERLSEMTGMPVEDIQSYESGRQPIPVHRLEVLAAALNRPVREFQDQHGPVGLWTSQQRAIQGLLELPTELQSFVSKPINRPYLDLAQRLSEMSVDKLRAVAEGLLEITL